MARTGGAAAGGLERNPGPVGPGRAQSPCSQEQPFSLAVMDRMIRVSTRLQAVAGVGLR